ncbi:MAG: hypothetical protein AB7G11_03000 [Phycisphaerales bacterium]
MKIVKKIKYVVLIVVVLLIAGIALAFYSIDVIAKKGIEKGATYALGVNTTLGSADVGILSGTFSMSDLNVSNPQGFSSPHFLSLGSGGVAVSLNTLRQQTVELPSLSLEHIDVNLERKEAGSNYNVILENLKKVSGDGGSKPSTPAGDEKRFVIRDLSIKDITVHLDLVGGPGAIGELTKVNIPIDEIKLTDVGKTGTGVSGTGVTLRELSSIIVQAVLGAAADKGGGLIPGDVLGDLQSRLAGLGDVKSLGMKVLGDAKGTIEQAGKKAIDDVTKKAQDAVKDTIDGGLKKLLPGGDKK